MKAFLFHRTPGEPVGIPPGFDLIPASAYVPAGRPVFVPDFAGEWVARPFVALRVSRLGKAIARKFAHRYYDAVTMGVWLVPLDMIQALTRAGEPMALSACFDGAMQTGEWLPLHEGDLTVKVNDSELVITPEQLAADEAVAVLSEYLTLKQGDILAPVRCPVEIPVSPGDRLTLTVDGQEVLTARYK